jgi:hypothetical protein
MLLIPEIKSSRFSSSRQLQDHAFNIFGLKVAVEDPLIEERSKPESTLLLSLMDHKWSPFGANSGLLSRFGSTSAKLQAGDAVDQIEKEDT